MRLRLPKPLHGWREFAGEVGIIVLGVLIALAADQLVDDWQSKTKLEEFRSALNQEVAYDLGAYEYRLKQSRCVTARLTELKRWERDWRAGRVTALNAPIGRPTMLSVVTSGWEARTGDVIEQMPLNERLAYGRLYDSLKIFSDIGQNEREVWRELAEFEAASRLDDAQLMRLHGLLKRAEGLNEIVQLNTRAVMEIVRPLGVRPFHDPKEIQPLDDLCQRVIGE